MAQAPQQRSSADVSDGCIGGLGCYVPRRILRRLQRVLGDVFDASSGDDVRRLAVSARLPLVRFFPAALLFVDISGFTRLSETFAKRGTSGCEQFSLATNEYFRHMLDLILEYGGDVDCFAGDALMVVFEATAQEEEDIGGEISSSCSAADDAGDAVDGGGRQKHMQLAVTNAVRCAMHLLQELSPFDTGRNDAAPLTLHCAISAGRVQAIDTGNQQQSGRFFSFLHGPPLDQLGVTHPATKSGECAMSTEAHAWASAAFEQGCALSPWMPTPLKNEAGYMIVPRDDGSSTAAKFSAIHKSSSTCCSTQVLPKQMLPLVSRDPKTLWRAGLVRALALVKLRRYVPSAVWQRLEAGQAQYLAEHRNVAVMFFKVDLHKSRLVSMQAHERTRLQKGVQMSVDIVQAKWGGATRQITFDDKGLVFIFAFGLPGFQFPNYAVRAVRAAMDARHALLQSSGIHISVGITAGACYCGPVGNPCLRSEYSIVGTTVNLAARIASAIFDHEVLVSEQVAQAVQQQAGGNTISFSLRRTAVMKGVEQPVSLLKPSEVRSAHRSRPRAMAFVGRKTEHGALVKQAQLVWENKSVPPSRHVALIVGQPGMGKSALLSAWLSDCPLDVRVLFGGAEELEVGTTLFALRSIVVAKMKSFNPDLMDHSVLNSIETVLDTVKVPTNDPMLMEFQERVAQVALLPRSAQPAQLKQLYLDLILLGSEKTVLVLEDIHWLDSSSWDVLLDLCKLTGNRLFVLLTSREEGDYPSASLLSKFTALRQLEQQVIEVWLEGLASAEISQIIASTLRAQRVDSDVTQVIQSRSSGTPLLVRELVFALCDAGVLRCDNGTCKSHGKLQETAAKLEPSVQGLIVTRLDRLSPEVGLCIKVASVFGGPFLEEDLLEVFPAFATGSESVMELLAAAEASHFLQVMADTHQDPDSNSCQDQEQSQQQMQQHKPRKAAVVWHFVHQLYREASYSLLLHQQRRQLHKVVAQSLGRRHGLEPSTISSTLARHWSAAIDEDHPDEDDVYKAVHYLHQASSFAFRLGSQTESLAFLHNAWQLVNRHLPQAEEYEADTLGKIFVAAYAAYLEVDADQKAALVQLAEKLDQRFSELLDKLSYEPTREIAFIVSRMILSSSSTTLKVPADAYVRLEKAAELVDMATACHTYAHLAMASAVEVNWLEVLRYAHMRLAAWKQSTKQELAQHWLRTYSDTPSHDISLALYASALVGNMQLFEKYEALQYAQMPTLSRDACFIMTSLATFCISLNLTGFASALDRAHRSLPSGGSADLGRITRWLRFSDSMLELGVMRHSRVVAAPERAEEVFSEMLELFRKTRFNVYHAGLMMVVQCWGNSSAARRLADASQERNGVGINTSERLRSLALAALFPADCDGGANGPCNSSLQAQVDWSNVHRLLKEALVAAHHDGHCLLALRAANTMMRAAVLRGSGQLEAAYALAGALDRMTFGLQKTADRFREVTDARRFLAEFSSTATTTTAGGIGSSSIRSSSATRRLRRVTLL